VRSINFIAKRIILDLIEFSIVRNAYPTRLYGNSAKNQGTQMVCRKVLIIEDDTDAADVLANLRGIEYRFQQP
jgi:hypothetical protein